MHYFLDIDGVLNTQSDWRTPFTLNERCVLAFSELLSKDSNPTIILSSTWRNGLEANRLTLSSHGINVNGVTPTSSKTRQEEIEYFIRRNNVDKYIILDDDISLFPRPDEFNLYITDYRTGFTAQDVKKLAKLLKRL